MIGYTLILWLRRENMNFKIVNDAPLGQAFNVSGKTSQVWDAYFRNMSAPAQFTPEFTALTGSGLTFRGNGIRYSSTFDFTVNIDQQSSSTHGTTKLILPFQCIFDGQAHIYDSSLGNYLYIGSALIPAGTNLCYLPSWTNKAKISIIGSYRIVSGN